MLSYQHGFHAGNRADMLKHAVLHAMLRDIARAGRPILHVETHAGRARYDLTGPQASKTGEAKDGVLSALAMASPPVPIEPWLRLARDAGPENYPGSPALAAMHLAERDRLILFEKHPAEFEALKSQFADDRRVQVKKEDGYSGALRLLPRRGEQMIVFSDPSYETLDDMEALAEWTPRALERWPNAVVIVWLPLFKDEREVAFGQFLAQLEDGIVAGARWPAESDKDSALIGSAMMAYRVSRPAQTEAARIAHALDELWQTA